MHIEQNMLHGTGKTCDKFARFQKNDEIPYLIQKTI